MSTISRLFGYLLTFLRALLLPWAALAARLLAAESQLAVCRLRIQQKKDPMGALSLEGDIALNALLRSGTSGRRRPRPGAATGLPRPLLWTPPTRARTPTPPANLSAL